MKERTRFRKDKKKKVAEISCKQQGSRNHWFLRNNWWECSTASWHDECVANASLMAEENKPRVVSPLGLMWIQLKINWLSPMWDQFKVCFCVFAFHCVPALQLKSKSCFVSLFSSFCRVKITLYYNLLLHHDDWFKFSMMLNSRVLLFRFCPYISFFYHFAKCIF